MHPYNVTSNPPRFLIGDWCDCRHLVATSRRQADERKMVAEFDWHDCRDRKFGSACLLLRLPSHGTVRLLAMVEYLDFFGVRQAGGTELFLGTSNELGEEIRAHAIGDGPYEAEHVDELRLRRVFRLLPSALNSKQNRSRNAQRAGRRDRDSWKGLLKQ